MKTFDKFLSAQEICEALYHDGFVTPLFRAGMSLRINGGDYSDLNSFANKSSMYGGFVAAEQMIDIGQIFYVHSFKCANAYCPTRFQYGGFWACNTCNTHINTPDWWKIKVAKDGNAWACTGDGFINLQESKNFAFGDTKDEAIENYRLLQTP